ncbi:YozE family protein [Pontibacillus litoralis]|uniref:YozE SAM-like domain-containing protein n=1 Tax=Pontibacillus litoralis JSM 072002 TaxID=1385512 RepID=A0A0A5G455_9BACI|nr:YozE family protein [Pontibacillus litoralis]KGX87901.1 hypothetical protein N784_12395 [Pontibacillus litoralis JSM 072002]
MKSFYQFMMSYRGKIEADEQSQLAEWMFQEHDFPKYSDSYEEISRYLEEHSPFASALRTFDYVWEQYEQERE